MDDTLTNHPPWLCLYNILREKCICCKAINRVMSAYFVLNGKRTSDSLTLDNLPRQQRLFFSFMQLSIHNKFYKIKNQWIQYFFLIIWTLNRKEKNWNRFLICDMDDKFFLAMQMQHVVTSHTMQRCHLLHGTLTRHRPWQRAPILFLSNRFSL